MKMLSTTRFSLFLHVTYKCEDQISRNYTFVYREDIDWVCARTKCWEGYWARR